MHTLVTYDLKSGPSDHNEIFLAAAQTEGLIFVTKGSTKNIIYRLPQSTVWGRFSSIAEAVEAFNRSIALTSRAVKYDVQVEKRMAVAFSTHGIRSNVSVPINPDYIGADDYETALLHQENVAPFKLARAPVLLVKTLA